MTRIAPLKPPYPADVDVALRSMMPPGVPPIALFRALVRHRSMTEAMRPWGAYELGRELTISFRQREIVIASVGVPTTPNASTLLDRTLPASVETILTVCCQNDRMLASRREQA